jgi:ribosomal-protein-alanine N-acetyltransferase
MSRESQYIKVRNITADDHEAMRDFFNSSIHLHQHLDWHTPEERLSSIPFLIAEKNNAPIAALCIPILNSDISWVHLFAAKKMIPLAKVWQPLFSAFIDYCQQNQLNRQIFSLAYYSWYLKLLENTNFTPAYAIVTLENDATYLPGYRGKFSGCAFQPITMNDISRIHQLDTLVFDLPWQMTEAAITKALRSSIYATMLMDNKQLIGYQITTESNNSLHLARIAVHPNFQNQGIGGFLIHDLLSFMKQHHYQGLSVNTQSNNQSSLSLYRKMGFYKTGSNIPVMVYNT